jgi:hypothetical protein
MNMHRRRARHLLSILALGGALAVVASTSALARPSVSPSKLPGNDDISSHYRGYLVWSTEIHHRWYLLERVRGHTMVLRTPTGTGTLDPKIGPDASGHPVAVYQRCGGPICVLERYDLLTGANRKMSWLGHPRRRAGEDLDFIAEGQTQPTIWKGRVAFQSVNGARAKIEIGPSGGPGPVRTLRAGPQGDQQDAYTLALGPTALLMTWEDFNCDLGDGCTDVLLDDLVTGHQRLLDQGVEADTCQSQVDSAFFDGHRFLWTKTAGSSGDPVTGGSGCRSFDRVYSYSPATRRVKQVSG